MATPGRRERGASQSSDDISVDDGDAEMVDAMTVDAQGTANGAQSSTISAGDLGKVPSVRLKVFDGSRRAGAYREWKKEVEAVQIIHQLTEKQLAPLVYLALDSKEGGPREVVEHLEIVADLAQDDGLQKLWKLLEEYELKSHVKADIALCGGSGNARSP